MDDIKEHLQDRGVESACFRVDDDGRCRMALLTEDESHLQEAIDEWGQVKEEDSDLHYTFRYMPFLDRDEQVSQIQTLLRVEGYTSILNSVEQEVADIVEEKGAEEVYHISHDNRILFLTEGEDLNEELPDKLNSLRKETDRMLLFFAPWFDGINGGTADEFRERGEPLLI